MEVDMEGFVGCEGGGTDATTMNYAAPVGGDLLILTYHDDDKGKKGMFNILSSVGIWKA